MPDNVEVTISGLAELGQSLEEIPLQFSRRIMRAALQAAGDVMATAAESQAPVLSGALKADIITKVHVGAGLEDNYVLVGPGYSRAELMVKATKIGKRGKITAVVDPGDSPGIYGEFVELGHKLEFGGASVPAHPWMRPAFDMSKEAALGVFIAYTDAGLEAVAAAVKRT